MRRSAFIVVSVVVIALALAGTASAQVVADRAALTTLLGAGAVTEGFEAFNVAASAATNTTLTTLDSTSVTGGQGPGLVVGGFSLSTTSAVLQWNGTAYYGLSSKTVTANGGPAVIDFTPPTTAFGVDLAEYQGYPETTVVTVYGPDRVTVLYTSPGISIPGPAAVFFGYQAAGGIGRVSITGPTWSWAPIVDNLTFGSAAVGGTGVPALSTAGLAALGLGLALAGAFALRRGVPA
jgi:hypothetical protein